MTKPAEAPAPKLSRMKYRELSTLDEGPPGTVLLVSDPGNFGKRYVVKSFEREGPDDDLPIARARAACEACDKLNHPALLTYHDFHLKKSWLKTVGAELLMEYVEGRSLDQLAERQPAPTVPQWVAVFAEVAAALERPAAVATGEGVRS